MNQKLFLYNTLSKASKAYVLKIEEPQWIEMTCDSPQMWIDKAELYFSNNKNDYSFVIFLINNSELLYKKLKVHSLYKIGYVSQFVKSSSLKRKDIMNICSKILLQINSKLGEFNLNLKLIKI